jgi:outer membrane protein OmpA-like peptidoglycan-associated protein
MRFLTFVSASLVLASIAGCKTAPSTSMPQPSPGSPSSTAAGQAPPNAATRAAATRANLAIEKVRLTELFRGTPVVLALQPDGSLRVEVPTHFSFDAGKAAVKPPLAAVLDRIAAGQRDELTRVLVSAPSDAATQGTALATERAASVRGHLVAHGLADTRIAPAPTAGTAVVRIVVTDMPLP